MILKNYWLSFLIGTLVFSVGCSEKQHQKHLGEMAADPNLADQNITKLVKVENIQVAFDLMSMPYHKQMMKVMNAEMKHLEGATHGLMITVMDYETKKTITGAKVNLTVINPKGDKKSTETEIMSGAGMHHYAIHLKAIEDGIYKIEAKIQISGKTYKARTELELKK